MNNERSFGFTLFILLLFAIAIVVPVSGVTIGSSAADTVITTPAASAAKPFISATVSDIAPTVGDPLTISGIATGGNVSSGVQIWVFAGNYVNVSTVPVKTDGSYSKTYSTAGLPPATYYVFVQNPGFDGDLDIDLQEAGIYTGQVVDTLTGALIFNFTGVGSAHDAVAAQSLSDAINRQGDDDAYTKLTFQLMAAPQPTSVISEPVSTGAAQIPATVPTTQAPMPVWLTLGAIAVGSIGASRYLRKN